MRILFIRKSSRSKFTDCPGKKYRNQINLRTNKNVWSLINMIKSPQRLYNPDGTIQHIELYEMC